MRTPWLYRYLSAMWERAARAPFPSKRASSNHPKGFEALSGYRLKQTVAQRNQIWKRRNRGFEINLPPSRPALQACCHPAVLQWLLGLQETFQGFLCVPRRSFFCAVPLRWRFTPAACSPRVWALRAGRIPPCTRCAGEAVPPQRARSARRRSRGAFPSAAMGSHALLTGTGCWEQSKPVPFHHKSVLSQLALVHKSHLQIFKMSLSIFPWSNVNITKYILARLDSKRPMFLCFLQRECFSWGPF